MGGRDAVPQTRFARMPCSDPEVTVFRISGSLGPRARSYLVRLTQECLRRDLPSVVLDLSDVDSLGGGSARLLNEFAAQRAARGFKTAFRVTSPTVRGFLYADHALQPPPIQTTLEQAIAAVRPKDRSLLLQGANPDARVGSAVPPGVQADDVIMSNDFPGPRPAPPIVLEESGARQHVHVLKPHPGGGGTPQAGSDMPYAGGGTPQAGSDTLERASSVGELQECLVRVLRERKLASRIHVFEQHADDKYYLVTRHGIDFERGLAAHGALARRLREHGAPGFLFDLCTEQLADSEEEVLAELNCEVVAPVTCGENTELLVFLSKEQPGDEYTLAELQEVETVLRSASAVMEGLRRERIEAARGNRSAAERVSSSDSGFPREPASELELVEPGATLEPRRLEHGGSGMEPRRLEHGGSGMEPRRVEHGGSDAESRRLEHAASARKPGLESRLHTPPAPPSRLVAPTPSPPLPLPKPPARRENEHERLIRRQLAQMRDILHLSQDFDAAFGTSRILEVLVLSVVSIARAETVLYFSERAGGYRLTHHRGLVPDAARELRLRGDSTLVQAALASERGVRIDVSSQVLDEERIWARQHGLQYAAPFRHKDRSIGLILLGNGSGRPDPDLEMLWSLLSQAALAYDRALLYETLQDRTLGVVRGLITLIESHNSFDCGSTEQVVRYTQALAREIQYPEDAIRDLVYGAVLRDVGMLRVSEMLLRSAQDLSADQWESIRRHPLEGASIMRQMRFSDVAVDVVLHHHEAYNGEGYPMGLRGRAIPLGARIVAVAESYVKMTMDRPYRKALGRAEALESLAENWGLRYDPLVVDALVRVVNRELSMGLKGDADLTRDLFGV